VREWCTVIKSHFNSAIHASSNKPTKAAMPTPAAQNHQSFIPISISFFWLLTIHEISYKDKLSINFSITKQATWISNYTPNCHMLWCVNFHFSVLSNTIKVRKILQQAAADLELLYVYTSSTLMASYRHVDGISYLRAHCLYTGISSGPKAL